MKTPSIVEVHEGHNVTLQCNAIGSPQPAVIWRRQDRQLIRFNGATGYGSKLKVDSPTVLPYFAKQAQVVL